MSDRVLISFCDHQVEFSIFTVLNDVTVNKPVELYNFFMRNELYFLQFILRPVLSGALGRSTCPPVFGHLLYGKSEFFRDLYFLKGRYSGSPIRTICHDQKGLDDA